MTYLFDMDGVLADWEDSFIPQYGDPSRMLEEELNAIKKKLANSDFYLNLKPLKAGIELFIHLRSLGNVAILTSVGKYNSEGVAEHKKQWLINNLGYLPDFYYTKSSKEKSMYVEKGILIDDRVKAVMPFKSAGGKAVLFVGCKDKALKDISEL